MNAQKILNEIEELHYWDARVLQMESSFFGDELRIVFEDTDFNVILLFNGCSKFSFVTSVDDRIKPLKELTKTQIPYFIQDIDITDVQIDGKDGKSGASGLAQSMITVQIFPHDSQLTLGILA